MRVRRRRSERGELEPCRALRGGRPAGLGTAVPGPRPRPPNDRREGDVRFGTGELVRSPAKRGKLKTTTMRLLLAFVAMSCAGILLAVSCSSDPAQETLCNPGDNIFCRCRGGMSGTKTCLPDGQSFGPCESALGQCDEIPSQGGNGSGASTGTGGEPPLPPPGELLGTCSIDQDCGGAHSS
jgi:hypothetical protein